MSAARLTVRDVLASVLRRRRGELLRFTGWSLLEAVPAFFAGRLVSHALDGGFLAGRPAVGFAWLAAMAASALIGAYGTRQSYRQLAAVVEPFRDELAGFAVSGALYRSTRFGARADTAAVARLTSQVEIVRDTFGSLLMIVQSFLITTVAALLGLMTLLPAALVLVLPPLVLGLVVFLAALAATAARQRAAVLAEEHVAESASTLGEGLRDVVACGGEERARASVAAHIDTHARLSREVARFTAVRTTALGLGGWLPLFLLLVGAPWLVRGGASTGAVLGALVYVMQGLQPAVQALVRHVGETGLWFVVVLGRVVESSGTVESQDSAAEPVRRRRGHELRLRGVTFGYGGRGEPVLRDLDLDVDEDEHLAIVGPSGVGKSTLAGLITGVLEPCAGEVRFGGEPVRPPARPEHSRVLIPQEAYVFAGSLEENLTYLCPKATAADLECAVEAVGSAPLVTALGGYAASVDPGALSAGERQLVALTRAFLSPAELVVLDEATCHLDPFAEARAEQAFARRRGTLVIVAHRISSALRARRILVLDGARVTLGTHEELLEGCRLYRDLIGHWDIGGHARPGTGGTDDRVASDVDRGK